MLAHVGDKSLIAEVHHFRAIKGRFKQLQEQMEELEDEMWGLTHKQHRCIRCLGHADVLQHIDDEEGQRITVVTPYQVK